MPKETTALKNRAWGDYARASKASPYTSPIRTARIKRLEKLLMGRLTKDAAPAAAAVGAGTKATFHQGGGQIGSTGTPVATGPKAIVQKITNKITDKLTGKSGGKAPEVPKKGLMGMGLKELGAGLLATFLLKELIGTMGDFGVIGQSRGEKEADLINQQAAGISAEDYYLQAALPQQAQSADAMKDMLMQALGQGAGVQPRRQTATGEELIGGI